jgi:hypothetical protein
MIPPRSNVLNGTLPLGETLPLTNRTLNFTVTARDNSLGAGGVAQASMVLTSVNAGTGFLITSPNTPGVTWPGGSTQTVTWNVSGSNVAPVNTANVRILLSTDGGNTFPIVLAESTPNDGSADVNMPFNLGTSQGRIMVEAVGNIFFDINNFNFTVTNVSPDVIPPTAIGSASNVTLPGATNHLITVEYADNVAVSAASIDGDDIVIQLPDTSTVPVTFVSRSSDLDTTPITAQYEFAPPGGFWSPSDNGTYQIVAVAGAVTDAALNPLAAGTIGAFEVNIMDIPGDFNGDGNLDCADVDELVLAISTGVTDLQYDVNNDGAVDPSDLNFWILDLKQTLLGDANLDFFVDGPDFNIWNANKFTAIPAWCSGDFNADGSVDGSDFNVWNANKFQAARPGGLSAKALQLPGMPVREESHASPRSRGPQAAIQAMREVPVHSPLWDSMRNVPLSRSSSGASAAKITDAHCDTARERGWASAEDDRTWDAVFASWA